MNFFEHQARAQQKTSYLYALMAMAVISLVLISCWLMAFWLGTGQDGEPSPLLFWEVLPTELTLAIVLGILGAITAATLFQYFRLRGDGGARIAEDLGGTLISHSTTNQFEKRALNVVEEMAIASGIPVPPVYVLNEAGINAFAAGHSPETAVIGLTRGCIESLTRDELQGVVAHEFSHIFHGDMKINMRLVALLFGILFIALIGEFILRSARFRTSSSKNNGGAIIIFGLIVFILGYCGVFFGNLIKAAVSRQREFLADASAVQYTRNPEGIAGALKKIGLQGSELTDSHASQFSHMYFSRGARSLVSLFATHPPLEDRITRIEPSWDGRFTTHLEQPQNKVQRTEKAQSSAQQTAAVMAGVVAATQLNRITPNPLDNNLDNIGASTAAHLSFAQQLLAQIPDDVRKTLENPYCARGAILGLFLDKSPTISTRQWDSLNVFNLGEELSELQSIAVKTQSLPVQLRLPLIEIALPSLKQLPKNLQQQFLELIQFFAKADGHVTMDEWSLLRIISAPLCQKNIHPQRAPTVEDMQCVLSTLAYLGAPSHAANFTALAEAAYEKGRELLPAIALPLMQQSAITLNKLDISLAALNQLPPLKKHGFLSRAAKIILHDNEITYREAELLRAVAASIECPMPPHLPL